MSKKPKHHRCPARPASAPLETLPATGLLRLPDVLRFVRVGKSTWWAGVKSHRYPQPVKTLGPRIAAWRAEDIHALIQGVGGAGQ